MDYLKSDSLIMFLSSWKDSLDLCRGDVHLAKRVVDRFVAVDCEEMKVVEIKDITHKGEVFKFNEIRETFLKAKKIWEKETDIPFPNIEISAEGIQNASLVSIYKDGILDYTTVVLDIELVQGKNQDFVLWILFHELGHLYLNEKGAGVWIDVGYKPSINLSSIFSLLILFSMAYPLSFLKGSLLYYPTFVVCLYIVFKSTFNLSDRLLNYLEEHFADGFATIASGYKKYHIRPFEGLFNSITHPNDYSRAKFIKNIEEDNIKDYVGSFRAEKSKYRLNVWDTWLSLF